MIVGKGLFYSARMVVESRVWWKSATKTWRRTYSAVYSAPWRSYGIVKVRDRVWPSSARVSPVWTTVKWISDGARLVLWVLAVGRRSLRIFSDTDQDTDHQCAFLWILTVKSNENRFSVALSFWRKNFLVQSLRLNHVRHNMCFAYVCGVNRIWRNCTKVFRV